MTTLTQRSHRRRAHLRLVTSDDRAEVWTPVHTAIDPEAGPKDVTELVGRFAGLLPADDGYDGVFSFGSL